MTADQPIVVTSHAIERARERKWRDVLDREARDGIIAEVRAALEAGRVANHKPKHWRLYKEKKGQLEPGQRFVWNHADEVGWIVKLDPAALVVVTTLHRVAPIGGLA